VAYRGKYKPRNAQKYRGDYTAIVYRSSWERKFFQYCDFNDKIISWASEEIVIPYRYMGKKHRYFPDVFIVYKDSEGIIKKKLIEIKPYNECHPPKKKKNQKKFINEINKYAKNQAKWAAAIEFCKINKLEWDVYTEYHLKIKVKPKSKILKEGINCRYEPQEDL